MIRGAATCVLLALCMTAPAETLLDRSGKPVRYAGKFSSRKIDLPAYTPRAVEFRGAWVATVANSDFARHQDAKSFMRDYRKLLDNLQRARINAVIFQVRSNCDAWYPSKINPWSRDLAGTEGRGIADFDPLQYMIRETHRRGMEFHAWLNPYRVGKGGGARSTFLNQLSAQNFARRNPHLVLGVPESAKVTYYFLDPGHPEVRKHILATVGELIGRYDIDAIHLDDYFYPYSGLADQDKTTFAKYNPAHLNRADWRRANTYAVIAGIRRLLDRRNAQGGRPVAFGISPFGIWANKSSHPAGSLTGGKECYTTLYADVRRWIKEQLIDYVVPQLYWSFDHETAAYAVLADWWSECVRGTGVRLFIGHGLYRLRSPGAWSSREWYNQLRYNQRNPEISGSVVFPAGALCVYANRNMREGIEFVLGNCWSRPARLPGYPRFSSKTK